MPRRAPSPPALALTSLLAAALLAAPRGAHAQQQPPQPSEQPPPQQAPATQARQHHRGRHASRSSASSAYRANVRTWHDASTAAPVARTADGSLVLRLYSLNTRERVEVAPGPAGGERFDAAAQARVSAVLADPRTHEAHPIDPRLLELLYTVATHFEAREVRVISGYRSGPGHSNHGLGRAIDFIIPGVRDRHVAAYARSLGEVGVGLYPVSGFVHLDVRDRATSWVDTSGPGRRPRYQHRRHRRHATR